MAAASPIPSGGAREAPARGGPPLAFAGLAALLASTCCVVPLLLAVVGVSGAWIGQLHRLEPYSAGLTALALVSLACAGWRLYKPAARGAAPACDAEAAACRTANAAARRWFWAVAVLALLPLAAPLIAPLFY